MALFKRNEKSTDGDSSSAPGQKAIRASAGIPHGYTLAAVSAGLFFAPRQTCLYTEEELTALKEAEEKTRAFREQISSQLRNDSLKTAHRAAQEAYDREPSEANFEALRNAPIPTDGEALRQISLLRQHVKEKIRQVAREIAPTVRTILERAAQVVDKEILAARIPEENLCQRYGLAYETGVCVGALQNLLRRLDRAIAGTDDSPEIGDLRGIVSELAANEPAPVAARPAEPAPEKSKRDRRTPPPLPPSDFNNFVAEHPVHVVEPESARE